jgi:hypothetical protein
MGCVFGGEKYFRLGCISARCDRRPQLGTLFGISQDLNLVALIFGYSIIARIVYILVGLSALYMTYYATTK